MKMRPNTLDLFIYTSYWKISISKQFNVSTFMNS